MRKKDKLSENIVYIIRTIELTQALSLVNYSWR